MSGSDNKSIFGDTSWQAGIKQAYQPQAQQYAQEYVQNNPEKKTGWWSNTWNKTKEGWNKGWNKTKEGVKNQMDEEKGFGAGNYIQSGIAAAGTIANIAIGAANTKLAQKKFEADQAQRKIENERYNAQMERINKATNDAASTASGLKSAGSNMSGKQAPQEQAQEPKAQQELPMERE